MSLDQSLEFQRVLNEAQNAARRASQVLLSFYGRLSQVTEKESAGLVSEADRTAERVIIDYLKEVFPSHSFLGEEQSFDEKTDPKTFQNYENLWIIDPLDGTTNYVHRFPIFCVSIGFQYKGELTVGVIDVPILGENFFAVKGQGAFLNDQPISVSPTEVLPNALAATGFFADNEKEHQEQMAVFGKLVQACRGVRRPGAAAYDLCMVAKGSFDFFWERNLKPWDSAAGTLLVREAGGVVKTYKGKEYTPFMNSVIASNPKLIDKVIEDIQPHLLAETD